jgi:DNA processing protein
MKVTNMLPKEETELFYRLALGFVPEVGTKTARALLTRYETAEAIFQAPLKEIATIYGIGEVRARMFKDEDIFRQAEHELKFIQANGIKVLLRGIDNYPSRLMQCDDAPVLLFYKGNADLNAEKVVAVVGTRKSTDYGQRATEDFIEGLRQEAEIVVTSGLALGIDTVAHKASLRNNIATVGVLGHGLDIIYPSSNKALAGEMLTNGGLLSEFPSGTQPNRQNFPLRNRIVAGLSDVTVIVESDAKGGAMITAYMAHSYNRDVAAFPGRVYDSKSGGPNLLIKRNIAAMITNAGDLLELMNWDKKKGKAVQKQLFLELQPDEQKIFDLLRDKDALHADDLLLASGFTSPQLAAVLLQLEMQNVIKTLPGKLYRTNI